MTVLSMVMRRICGICWPVRRIEADGGQSDVLPIKCSHCGWQPKDHWEKQIPPRICPRCA